MAPALALQCDLNGDETLPSWVSRLAVLNCADTAREFCLDLGLHFRACVAGQRSALTKLSDLTGVPTEVLERASFVTQGRELFLRGERFGLSMVRRSRIHICPLCAREDIRAARNSFTPAPYGRILWQIAAMRSCRRHGCALIEVARNTGLAMHDFALNLKGRSDEVLQAADRVDARSPSLLETYLTHRLEIRPTGSAWLDRLPLNVVIPTCETLGTVILYGPKMRLLAMSDSDLHRAGEAGFQVARQGGPSIRKTLTEIAKSHVSKVHGREGPGAVFGAFYQFLARHHQDEAFEPVCDLVRRHAVETMPFGPGDVVLGKPVKRRMIHSAITASRETGRTPVHLRKILAAHGLISSDHRRFSSHAVIFDATAAEEFLQAGADSLRLSEIAAYLNISRYQAVQLAKHGLIQHLAEYSTKDNLRLRVYARKAIDEFLAGLMIHTEPVETARETLVPVITAAKQARCDFAVLIEMILKNQLKWVGRAIGQSGIPSLLVDIFEIRQAIDANPDGITLPKAREVLKTTRAVVGRLVDQGFIEHKIAVLASTRNPARLVDRSSLEKFRGSYVSISELMEIHSKSYRSICSCLSDVSPAIEKSRVGLAYYRRTDIPPL
jgi:hypothetical protein